MYGTLGGYIFLAYMNSSPNATILEKVQVDCSNVQICLPYNNNNSFEICVKHGENKVVKYDILPS